MFNYITSLMDIEDHYKLDNGYHYLYGVTLKTNLSKALKEKDYFNIVVYDSLNKEIIFYADDNMCDGKYIYSLKDIGEYNV